MTDRPPVFVTRELSLGLIENLRLELGAEVSPHDRPLSRDELKAAVAGRTALITMLDDRVDSEILDAAGPRLRIVANHAVGYDNVDVEAATRRRIAVTNTPGVLDEATATLAVALLLAIARRIVEADTYVRAGRWTRGWAPNFFTGLDVDGRVLGIAGLGRIGRALARKATGLGLRVIYTARQRDAAAEDETGALFVDKDTLFRSADFVAPCLSVNESTWHYVGARELAMMKPSAALINVSRGPIVDEGALAAVLAARGIAGAALDVFENEPALTPGLIELDNVVLTPHIGSATVETRSAMGSIAIRNVLARARGEPPISCVNPSIWEDLGGQR